MSSPARWRSGPPTGTRPFWFGPVMSTSRGARTERGPGRRGSRRLRRSPAATAAILIAGVLAIGAAVALDETGTLSGFAQGTVNQRFQVRHVAAPHGITLGT